MYTQLAEIAQPTSAEFTSPQSIRLTFSKRDHTRNLKRNLSKSVLITTPTEPVSTGYEDNDDIVLSLVSPTLSLRAILRETNKSTPNARRFVEIWLGDRLVVCKDVTNVHSKFYSDEFVSSICFSPDDSSLLYIAELNPPEAGSTDTFAKFRYTPHFGEGLPNLKRPAIFILTWSASEPAQSEVAHLYQLSIDTQYAEPVHFGQAIFSKTSPTTLYATGYEQSPDGRLLGIKYCFNRPFGIWRIQVDLPSAQAQTDGNNSTTATVVRCTAEKLTSSDLSCRSPRTYINQNKEESLLYLSCPSGGPHASTSTLHISSPPATLIPPTDATASFPGLYAPFTLARSCILSHPTWDSPKLITHSTWGSRFTLALVSLSSPITVANLTPLDLSHFSYTLLTTNSHTSFVCVRSSPSTPYQVLLGSIDPAQPFSVSFMKIHEPTLPPFLAKSIASLTTRVLSVPNCEPVETILIHPPRDAKKTESDDPPPLILIPHGGPHSTSTTEFNPLQAALALSGYTLALPNYHGTPGFGESFVRSLIGKCGTLDVNDCIQALRHLFDQRIALSDPRKTFLLGGSHGGFLAAHLIGQFPGVFGAAVMRNPVVSGGDTTGSDIPDWYFAEFGLERRGSEGPILDAQPTTTSAVRTVTPTVYNSLYNASPTQYVHGITTPVLLFVGSADLRVSPTQGMGYYHLLKGAGKKVEMLIFEGEGHPLEGVEAAKVGCEAIMDWFKQVKDGQ
ncbi:hypothetical protein AMATHDRAFT_74219 [Amanita thiersii Skay4041]|uniref:acylaminoacyl-peptidase n=1 Tax=Amanita thiersii Skay4041 TaxID=703135 RepID=A0A2A9NVW2_9AGAR|nr:hypothetical protein AMATHDRAFT_74219 [Amanita thiersii Skay4041]